MGESSAVPDTERWRSKYFDTLSDLENKERLWRQMEEMLRQGLARLTLVTDPADRALLTVAERLREALRRGQESSELEPLFTSLAAEVSRHTQQPPPAQTAATLLRELMEGLDLPVEFAPRLRALRKRAEGNDDPFAISRELGDLLRDSARSLQESASGTPAGDSRPGLLDRLLRRTNGSAEATAPAEGEGADTTPLPLRLTRDVLHLFIVDLLEGRPVDRVQLEPRLRIATSEESLRALALDVLKVLHELVRGGTQPSAPPAPPAPSAPAAATPTLPPHELLIQLLERLPVPQEFQTRVESLKAEFAPGLTPESTTRAIVGVVELITAMRSRVQQEKEELERFLQQLTANLQELDVNLRSTVASHRESMQEGHALGVAVEIQMQGLASSMQAATELNALKELIRDRLATLQRHVEGFRQAEEERIRRAEDEAKRLTARLAEMEQEAGQLRERVRAERNQALMDPLTGVFNRLAYNERIAQEFARWRRYRDPLCFSVWDVDHFKRINDTYGHQAGDKVLRVIAKLLSAQTRETDFLARYGGEEFVLLLPKTQIHQARFVAEKLRTAVQACEFHYKERPVHITISCGLTGFREGDDPEMVFSRADQALYLAKQGGRNRCIVKE